MTDKQQPEALELASVAESADLVGYPTAKKANAYYLCLLEDCAQMIRKLHAENESLRAKLKTYEDLGEAADNMQLLRMGYAAARLEIESLRSQAPQPSPAAQVDALDAARWHWLAGYLVGPRTDLDDEIVASETVNDLRKLVDAARAAQEDKSCPKE